MNKRYFFFPRAASEGNPGGITVSKQPFLPSGDFEITEWTWHGMGQYVVLWFVKHDRFTAAEREQAKNQYLGI